MNFVKRAQRVALTSCCASSVGFERSTSVDVSMSIWKKPAGIASSMSASIAPISCSGACFIFFGFVWKWSPWRKNGPVHSSRIAAASMTAAYSAGRCSV